MVLLPPAEFMSEATDTKKQQNEQKFYIYSDVSHTHTLQKEIAIKLNVL